MLRPDQILNWLLATEHDEELAERLRLFIVAMSALVQTAATLGLGFWLALRDDVFGMQTGFVGAGLTMLAGLLLYRRRFTVLSAHLQLVAVFGCLGSMCVKHTPHGASVLIWALPALASAAFVLPLLQSFTWLLIAIGVIALVLTTVAKDAVASGTPHTAEYLGPLAVHVYGSLLALAILVLIMRAASIYHARSLRLAKANLRRNLEESQLLLRILSHDVANPLMIVQHHIERLRESESHHIERNDRIARIERAVESVSSILSSVHALRSLLDGKRKLQRESVNLAVLVRETVETFAEWIEAKQLRLELMVSEETIPIDPHLFKNEVLANLLSNAIKFSPPGGTIAVTAEVTDAQVVFQVRDRGEGIPAERLAAIYSFSHSTTTPGTLGEKGTGFGLPIAQRILALMDGTLELRSTTKQESASDHGTVAIITLPRVG